MMKRLVPGVFSRLLVTCLLLSSLGLAAAENPSFAHESSDLKADPAVRYGKLPNGLRYAVLKNAEPKGRASLRLLVEAGSFHERDNQRGLAHFLEHMAFNGSQHYAPGTLVEFFQRMGMSFGGDTNASTSFNRTLYLLELADTKEATTAEGLRVFADYAGGLLLLGEEIDKERGIILSEKRARDSVGFRTFVDQFSYVLSGTLPPDRIPIGLPEIIQNAPRERFVEFYDTWYRPELITVVAVGDFDPAQVERQLVATFTPLKARAPAAAAPDLGKIASRTGTQIHYRAEPEAPNTTISIGWIKQIGAEPDNAANRIKDLPRTLAHAMLNRRFFNLAKKENAPFLSARASTSDQYDFYRDTSVDITTKADQWAQGLAVGEQEVRRALEFGFQPGELNEVKALFFNNLEQAVKTASTRRSNDLADTLADCVLEKNVYTTPADDLALYKPAIEKITLEDCLAALRTAWSGNHRLIMVSGNAVIPSPDTTIAAAYEASTRVPVSAPAREAAVAWSYTDFGPAGKVAQRSEVADLGITQVVFANGVRLNLKKTDFKADEVLLSIRIGNGSITEPAHQRGLAALAGGIFDAGGLGKHSTDDLMRIFSGKNVSVRFRPASDAFEFTGDTTPEDLLLALQFATAKITDAGYRPEALRTARKSIEQMFNAFDHTPNGPLSLEVANLLASGDPRFGTPPKDVLLSRTSDEVKAWLTPQFAHGAVEIGLVGDFNVEAAIDAVARTLGALPTREAKPALTELKQVKFPAQPFQKDYTITSQIPKGAAVFYWPTTDGLDAKVSRRLNLLASVLTDRLRVKVREEMGGTYSPSARSSASDTFPGYGYFQSSIDIAPGMEGKIASAVAGISDDLFEHGVTADELDRMKKPMLTSIRESSRTNGYWLGSVLSRTQEKPELLDWARNRESDVASISEAELDRLAKEYLSPTRLSRVVILPKATPKS